MDNKFNYNRPSAKCQFCKRTKNPHPSFDEPLVTAFFKSSNNKKVEICINCYCEIQEIVAEGRHSFERIVDWKENLRRLFEKINLNPKKDREDDYSN